MKWDQSKNTPSWPANRNFGLTDQAIIFKQSDLIRNDNNFSTAHDSLPYLSTYPATQLSYLLGPNQVNATIPLCSNQPQHSSSHVATSSVGLLVASSTLSAALKTGPDVVGDKVPYATHDLAIVVCIILFSWGVYHFRFSVPNLLQCICTNFKQNLYDLVYLT